MDTLHSTMRLAKRFFLGTSLSRVSGLFRDIAMALYFGSSFEIATFMVAYRLANLFRRLLGDGNLQSGMVPCFEEMRGRDPRSAFIFYRDAAFSFFAMVGGVVLVSMVVLWQLQDRLPLKWGRIAFLAFWMTPGLLFICLSALNTALLQCQKRYFAPAAAPVLFNGVWIASVWAAHTFFPADPMLFLSIGVSFAFAAQWALTGLQAFFEWHKHLSVKEWFSPSLFSSSWKKVLAPMGLGVVGAGAMQINSALDAIFASVADPSGPAYLWYAIRIEQLPLSLFGIALSSALLPPLSRAIQAGDTAKHRALLRGFCQRAMVWMIPFSLALFALGAAGLNFLYGRGDFGSAGLVQTLFCLWGYGLGLAPAALTLLLAAGCYAKKSYKAPTLASLISMGLHLVLNGTFVFVFHWGAVSIALATGLSAWVNYAVLAWGAKIIDFRIMGKAGLAGLGAWAVAIQAGAWWLGDPTLAILQGKEALFSSGLCGQCLQAGGMGGLFLGSFLGIGRMMGLFAEAGELSKANPEEASGST